MFINLICDKVKGYACFYLIKRDAYKIEFSHCEIALFNDVKFRKRRWEGNNTYALF